MASPPFHRSLSPKEDDSYHVQSVPLGGERGPQGPQAGCDPPACLYCGSLSFSCSSRAQTTLRPPRTHTGAKELMEAERREKKYPGFFFFTNHLGYSRPDQAAKPGITPIPEGLRAGDLVCIVFIEKVAHCWSCYLPSPTGSFSQVTKVSKVQRNGPWARNQDALVPASLLIHAAA